MKKIKEGHKNLAFEKDDQDNFARRTTGAVQDTGAGGEATVARHEKSSSRYRGALNTLIPVRRTRNDNFLPVNHVGLINYLTVGWLSKIMWKAMKSGLTSADILPLSTEDDARRNAERMQRLWDEEVAACKLAGGDGARPSLSRVVWRFGKTRFLVALCLVFFSMIFQFIGPSLLLKYLLEFLDDPSAELSYGIMVLVFLFLSQLLRNITFNLQQSIGIHTAMRALGALQFLGYSKLLRLGTPSDAALGQLITFVAADHERIQEACVMGTLFIGAPVSFVLSMAYAIYLVGPSALVGCFFVLLFYPFMGGLAKLQSHYRERVVSITDKRVTSMKEIIDAMRLIKMYAWEESFLSRILELRNKEIQELMKAGFLMSVSLTVSPSISIFAGFGTFIVMTLAGVELDTTSAFTVVSVFSNLQFSISTLPLAVRHISEAKVGFGRLQQFLELGEYKNPCKKTGSSDSKYRVEMRRACYSWDVTRDTHKANKKKQSNNVQQKNMNDGKSDEKGVPTLFNLDVLLENCSLTGVAGLVGAGKSSLLSAILGEMKLTEGTSKVNGSIAYVSQQSWIFNGTVRDNILMGSELEADWYNYVVEVSALARDFQLLERGDLTEVGERGITLSGGQKQRLSLARALYARADIYLLDDPLSAVDAKVGQDIFQKYVKEALKDKTVLLVSHGMQYLTCCDSVLFMKDGKIVEEGDPNALLEKPDGYLANMAKFDQKRDKVKKEVKKAKNETEDSNIEEEDALQKTEKEESSAHEGSLKILMKYFGFCGHPVIMTVIFILLVCFIFLRMGERIFLQNWLNQGDGLETERMMNESFINATDHQLRGFINYNPDLWKYQLGYTGVIFGMLLCGMLKGIGILLKLMGGSRRIHKIMVLNVMRSPMAFFDVTPSGWILNRFSKDMDIMDTKIPFSVEAVGQYLLLTTCQVLLTCFYIPWFTLAFVAIILVVIVIDWTMHHGVKETKRLDNQLKAPVIHHITSSMAGIITIRAFQKEEVFLQRFNRFLNTSTSADSLFRLSTRWFMWRMETMALVAVTLTSVFCVAFKSHVSPAVAGLVMVNVFQTAVFVPFVMQLKANFIAFLNSLQRNFQYTSLAQEAAAVVPGRSPAPSWPERGAIRLEGVSFRYRPELPLVLRSVTVNIAGGEKVGIVGRTGAGKSSLISTLLRMTELDSGRLLIDGLDVSGIGLTELRSAVAVIPQDPVLFQGTVRYNIDPFSRATDAEVWRALEEANLRDKVGRDRAGLGLDMVVEADGDNFSVGEKQLICLARALLRKNKILLLDEATASVDVRTDHLIQNTIQTQFRGCTVLTIAHRLNTVLGYHKVMVLDHGALVQCDTPANLLAREGLFREMASAAGLVKN